MKINAELVAKFVSNECSSEEAEFITVYFEAHPEALEKYIGEAEWKQFATTHSIQPDKSQQLLRQIRQNAAVTPQIHYRRYMVAAAAVLLLLITGSIYWLLNQPNRTILAATDKTAKAGLHAMVITNTSAKDKQLSLEDGSTVTLTPGSTLQYTTPFGLQQRYLALEGKALFKVAHDKNRPFMVAAGGLVTTALGTSFWVDSKQSNNEIHIKLITGSVVIRQDSTRLMANFKPVYLRPGQELVFDRQNQLSKVLSGFTPLAAKAPSIKDNAAAKEILVFNQQPLPEVLQILQKRFNVSISFNEEQLKYIKFSGSYTATDNLDDILEAVILINELKLEKTSTGFTISQ